jgi:hypothetical protein
VRTALIRHRWPRATAATLGAVALVASFVLWSRLERSSSFLAHGGLGTQALLSALVILAATLPGGPVRRLGQLAPLRRLGRISYAVYLFHWPLFVWLTPARTGLGHGATFALVVGLALLLAEISFRVLEMPVRRGRGVAGVDALRLRVVAPFVLTTLIAGVVVVNRMPAPTTGFDAERAGATLTRLRRHGSIRPIAKNSTFAPVPRFAFFGDSISLSLALSTTPWELHTHRALGTDGVTELGCGIVRGGLQRSDFVAPVAARCDAWPSTWAAALDEGHADLALVMSGQWELVDHKLPGDMQWRHPGDPVYDDTVRREYLAATDLLSSRGAVVAWITVPHFGDPDTLLSDAMRASHDPARVDRVNQIIREVVAARPKTARLIDLAAWMQQRTNDRVLRKDGAHFNFNDRDYVGTRFLGPEILRVWNDVRHSGQG